MKVNWYILTWWLCSFTVGIIGWILLIYITVQIYFWFNPSPSHFWFFTIFNQGGK